MHTFLIAVSLFTTCPITVNVITTELVLRTAISLYMADDDVHKGLPLPSFEEILVCNSHTTSEEVKY